MSLVVLMGSGETAPTMVKLHRRVLARTYPDGAPAADDAPAVLLDTPFGFQDNADELVARTATYFGDTVGQQVRVATWRRRDTPGVAAEQSLALLGRARWAFAGPGSPSYALRQWHGTAVPPALADVVRRGGSLVVGSAAACTVGASALPVYEIYKAGADLGWDAGLDLLAELAGIRAAVLPHYDNAEGGSYDTRYCYLGANRLAAMEQLLPDDVGVLGVDEHTALVLDLDAGTASVTGKGGVTLRRRGTETVLRDGEQLGVAEVAAVLSGTTVPPGTTGAPRARPAGGTASGDPAPGDGAAGTLDGAPSDPVVDESTLSLRDAAEAHRARFETAVAARDVDTAVAEVLGLEQVLVDWSADTLQSDEADRARRYLRAMVVRLGELAVAGAADPREAVRPLVEALLELRAVARAAKDFATSDRVRDALVGAGVEVRDTPDGVEWVLAGQ